MDSTSNVSLSRLIFLEPLSDSYRVPINQLHQQTLELLHLDRIENNGSTVWAYLRDVETQRGDKVAQSYAKLIKQSFELLSSSEPNCAPDWAEVTREMKKLGFEATKTFQRLNHQGRVYLAAKDKMDAILKKYHISKQRTQTEPLETDSTTKLRIEVVQGRKAGTLSYEEFLTSLNYFNELPNNNIFKEITTSLGNFYFLNRISQFRIEPL